MTLNYVIRTCNSIRVLPHVIERLLVHNHASAIICVDSGSSDETLPYLKGLGIQIIQWSRPFSYGGTLNAGFAACTSEWVVSLSSHCVPALESYGADIVRVIGDMSNDITVVAGTVVHNASKIAIGDDIIMARGTSVAIFADFLVGNPNCAYRRCAWEKRHFDESLAANEDRDWCIRALRSGEQAAVSFAFPVLYRNQLALREMFRKGFREGFQEEGLSGSFVRTYVSNGKVNIMRIARAFALRIGRRLGDCAWSFRAPIRRRRGL